MYSKVIRLYIYKRIYIYIYIYIHTHTHILFQILFPYRLLQNIEYSSLCSTVGPCWLPILYIAVYNCLSQTSNLSLPPLSPLVTISLYSMSVGLLKTWNASRICVSSLNKGHANLLCMVPILVYVLPKQACFFVFYPSLFFPNWVEDINIARYHKFKWI